MAIYALSGTGLFCYLEHYHPFIQNRRANASHSLSSPCPLPLLPPAPSSVCKHMPLLITVLGCPYIDHTYLPYLQGPGQDFHTLSILSIHPPFTCRASARLSISSSSASKLHAPAVSLSSYWLNSGCGP